jgi:Putative addiction module component
MSMTVDQLVSEARQLPLDLRAELLDRLGETMHGEAPREIADEWNRLALERRAAVQSGRSQLRPGEEVMARMRQLIGR